MPQFPCWNHGLEVSRDYLTQQRVARAALTKSKSLGQAGFSGALLWTETMRAVFPLDAQPNDFEDRI